MNKKQLEKFEGLPEEISMTAGLFKSANYFVSGAGCLSIVYQFSFT